MANFKSVGDFEKTEFSYIRYTEPKLDTALPENVKVAREGDTLAEGVYMGTTQGRFGLVYQVRTADNKVTVLGSAGNLAYKMGKVKQGQSIQISYLGKQPMTKGKHIGTLAHQFDVGADLEAAIDESAAPINFTSSSEGALESASNSEAWA